MNTGFPSSCLKINGKSGVYTLQLNSQSQPFMVSKYFVNVFVDVISLPTFYF